MRLALLLCGLVSWTGLLVQDVSAEALPGAAAHEVHSAPVWHLITQTEAASARGDLPLALEHGRKALALARAQQEWYGEVKSLRLLGLVARHMGDYHAARTWHQQALEIARAAGAHEEEGKNLIDLGDVDERQKDWAAAVIRYQQAIGLLQRPEAWKELGRARYKLGDVYSAMGEYARAYGFYAQAVEDARDRHDPQQQAICLDHLGYFFAVLGDFEHAIQIHQQALVQATAIPDALQQAQARVRALTHLGQLYAEVQDDSQARDSYEAALTQVQRIGDRAQEATLRRHLGHYVYEKLAEQAGEGRHKARYYALALEHHQRALALARAMPRPEWEGLALHHLGHVYAGLGDFAKAADVLHQALALWLTLADLHKAIDAYQDIGAYVAEKAGKDLDALEAYEQGLSLARRLGAADTIVALQLRRGGVLERLERRDAAEAAYDDAIETLETMRHQLTAQEHKIALLEKRLRPYEAMIDLLSARARQSAAPGLVERAFHYAERAKARAFLELLAAARKHPAAGDPSPSFAAVTAPQPPTSAALPLAPGEVLLEFKATDTALYLWVVRQDQPLRFFVLPDRQALLRQIETFLAHITSPQLDDFDPAEAYALYQSLRLHEALAGVPRGSHLVIVPDDLLFRLPFEVLVVTMQAPQKHYTVDAIPFYSGVRALGQEWAITYYPSAGTLLVNRQGRRPAPVWPAPLLALGDPHYPVAEPTPLLLTQRGVAAVTAALPQPVFTRLPGTRQEVQAIARLLQVPADSTDVLLGSNATKAQLLQHDLRRYRFLHLAVHGVLQIAGLGVQQPALVLGGGGEDTRQMLLTMEEVIGLQGQLDAELVVLSACQTGRGRERRGEGVIGLARAFLYAAAPSVVVSLWQVYDASTAQLMSRLYHYVINERLDKARALQRARLDLLEGYTDATAGKPVHYPHPFFWAPFILVGEP